MAAPAQVNLVDRLVGWVNPAAGLRRISARHTLNQIARAYAPHEAATPGRSRKFYTDRTGPNTIVGISAPAIMVQARHLERNNDIARGILRTMRNAIVGPSGIGIEPQPRRADGSIHEEYAAALRALHREWSKSPEVTGLHTESATQRMACNAWIRDGEVFAQQVIGPVAKYTHATRLPYALELFEADMVPHSYSEGDTIRQGIERSAWGRPIAYHVYKNHPGELTTAASGLLGSDLKRIPADRVVHLATRDRIGQIRGISEFASVIARLEDIKDYEDSERIAAKVAAALTAYVKKTNPEGYDPASATTDANGNIIPRDLAMSPGTIIDGLQVGEEIGLIDSSRPNPNAVTFRQGQLRAVAAGIGASYSSIARSYDGTYSAQRQELVEQWVNYACLTDQFCGSWVQPVWDTFVTVAHISGVVRIPADVVPGTENDALYVAQAMPWIDPLKEANALVELTRAGFMSEVEAIRRAGKNPRDVLEQIIAFRNKVREAGLLFTSDGANPISGASTSAAATPTPNAAGQQQP